MVVCNGDVVRSINIDALVGWYCDGEAIDDNVVLP